MRFKTPTDALNFFWDVLRSGGVPLAPMVYDDEENEYTRVQVSRRAWTPSDALCTYVDIGKALERLSPKDQAIVKSYLLDVVGNNGDRPRVSFNRWKHKNFWRSVMKKLWAQIPGEYKQWT